MVIEEKARRVFPHLVGLIRRKIHRQHIKGLGTQQKLHQEKNKQQDEVYSKKETTHFGFQDVTEYEKAEKVKNVFANVAWKYDVMNDCMSLGIHRVWKDVFMNRLSPTKNTKLLDMAGGTGDIAFRFLNFKEEKYVDKMFSAPFPFNEMPIAPKITENEVEAQYFADEVRKESPSEASINQCHVLVCDINPDMLEVGKTRASSALAREDLKRIDWMVGDAEKLPDLKDNSFDAYTIAFGIRNCVHIEKVLKEAYRILKPGGRFMCLEFSQLPNDSLQWLYDQYSFQVIPAMGQVIAGDWESYLYLVESIRKFPDQETFKAMIEEAGFSFVTFENLSFGIAAIHSGYKI